MKKIRLEISGMTCDHCARTVERAMESIPGTRDASASYPAGRGEAHVEDAVSARDLTGAVERAGYGARVVDDSTRPGAREYQDGAGGDAGFDLLVIGTGAAGMAAAIRGAELGRRVGIVEAGTVGGTCVNVGCIPSKNLLAVAEAVHSARTGMPGLTGFEPTVDWSEIRDRKDSIVGSLRQSKYLDVLDGYPEITLLRGEARLDADGTVEVAGTRHHADKVVIATGTSPWTPPISGIDEVDVLTSTTAMELETLPESMIVLGGSAVGLELGQVFARLGVRITVLELLPQLLAGEEQDAAEALRRHLEAEGLEIVTDFEVRSVERVGTGLRVHGRTSGGDRVFEGERLLAATGRRPSTGSLSLESAGIETDVKGFIGVDDGMRTSNPDVYAAGDVAGLPGFVYVAAAAGRVAAENAVGTGGRTLDLRAVPRVTFTSPQVASVGIGPAQAREQGIEVDVSRLGLEHVPRAIVELRTAGWIQVVAEKESGRILGAQAVAPNAAELLGEATVAVRLGLTIQDVTDTLHPYLTWVEGFKLTVQAFETDVSKLSCCA